MSNAFRTFSFLYKRTSNWRGKKCEGKFSVQKLRKKKKRDEILGKKTLRTNYILQRFLKLGAGKRDHKEIKLWVLEVKSCSSICIRKITYLDLHSLLCKILEFD